MGRLLLQGSRFLVLSAALYLVVFYILTNTVFLGRPLIYRTSDYYQWKGGAAWMQYAEFDPTARWDAVVLGSSHAYRGYDPRVFQNRGYRMFNLGSSAQTPMNGYYVLKQYADSARIPLVIFDMYENAFTQDGLESTSELTQHVPSDVEAWGMAWGVHDLRAVNMMALRYFTRDVGPMFTDSTYRGAGYAVRTARAPANVRYDVGRPLRMNANQRRYFTACIDLCRARGVELVFTTHFYPHQSDTAKHTLFHHFVDSTARVHGLRYLDFAYAHELSDTDHFCDHNHLNETGARIFNVRLVDSLVANGYLPRR